ncbi:MAG: DUF2846 domain-containing protein [Nitrospirales bacterium]
MNGRRFVVQSLVIVCAAILFGCGGGQLGEVYKRAESIPSDKTLIYIYRIPAFVGGIYPVGIDVNGKEITSLSEGAYYPYLSDPGEVEVSTKMAIARGESVTVDGKAGQVYYLEVWARPGAFSGQAAMKRVSKERGEEKLLETRRVLDK